MIGYREGLLFLEDNLLYEGNDCIMVDDFCFIMC